MMIKLKLLGAAVILAAVAAAPTLAQAHRHHRHHHHHRYHHHHHWFSYNHNYGPGLLPGTYAYYDGPTAARCKQSAAAYRGQDGQRHPCF